MANQGKGMSAAVDLACCASCGESEDEDSGCKLKTCTACKSVKYCSVDCQRDHRKQHKKECKRIEKELKGAGAAADLAALNISGETKGDTCSDDEDLFKPPPPKEDCALCFLPLPNIPHETMYYACCGKKVCCGCSIKQSAVMWWMNQKRDAKDPPETPLEETCPFCRADASIETVKKMALRRLTKRMTLNDPVAFYTMAQHYVYGEYGLPENEDKAFELFLRAAELGSSDASFCVSQHYNEGGVLGFSNPKSMQYLELAAKRGHVQARCYLGATEVHLGNYERAVKHWMISTAAGCDDSLKCIGHAYREKKHATKSQFEGSLRAHQKAKEEMSSDERKMAKKVKKDSGSIDLSALNESEFAALCGVRKTDDYAFFSRCFRKLLVQMREDSR